MPSYNVMQTLTQILRLDPAIFDGPAEQLGFSCDGYQVTIHIQGNGELEIERKNSRETIHIGPFTLAAAHKAIVPVMYPETYAVVSMLLERYQEYRAGLARAKTPSRPAVMSLSEVSEACPNLKPTVTQPAPP